MDVAYWVSGDREDCRRRASTRVVLFMRLDRLVALEDLEDRDGKGNLMHVLGRVDR